MADVKVFVSYSWSVEKTTGVVDEIEALCLPRGIELVRDKNAMKHGDVILEFMNNLSSGDHIITVFSKPYFKSPWCMHELLKIWQKGEIKERTHPVIADDCNLQDVAYRIEVVKHWTAEHDKIKGLLEGVDPALIGREYEEANRIRDISQNVSDLMNFAMGRLMTPLVDLRAQDYAQILDQIRMPVNQSGLVNLQKVDFNLQERDMESSKARKISQLEEQLEIWEEKLHEFKMQLAQTADPDTKFSIKSKIKREINPEIDKINKQYQVVLRDIELMEGEAESIVAELVDVVENEPVGLSTEITEQLALIKQEIQDQNKSATAKLKVTLPILPLLANYELDLDTENFLGEVWSKVRGLLKKKANNVNPK